MSLYGDAMAAIRSIILVEERVRAVAAKVDSLADETRRIADRVTRLEAIVEIVRPDGSVLRIAPSTPAD